MKIEKTKRYAVGERTFHTLRDAQIYLLSAWLYNAVEGGGDDAVSAIVYAIMDSPEHFRELVAPFIFKPRGRKPKAATPQLVAGDDGEPMAAQAA